MGGARVVVVAFLHELGTVCPETSHIAMEADLRN